MEHISTLLAETNGWIVLWMILAGTAAFVLSTLSGGGGTLVLVPVLNWTVGVSNTAPILNLGSFLGRPARLLIFWKHIQWEVCLYYAPAAILGAWLGSWMFSNIRLEWLQLVVGLFLISTVFQYRFGQKERSFEMQLWYFIPLGLIISVLGTLIGALGPVLNPFYLNLGLDKEDLIATKTANSFLMGLSQISSYTFFGLLHDQFWLYGLALGIGATFGNLIGKKFLARMKSSTFRKWVIGLMVISGFIWVIRQTVGLLDM